MHVKNPVQTILNTAVLWKQQRSLSYPTNFVSLNNFIKGEFCSASDVE